MVRIFLLQCVKEQVNGVLKALVVLPHLHSVQHLYQCGKILFVGRGLVVDIADQRRIQKRLRLDPEIVTGLSLPFGVGDQGSDNLQNILFRMDIRKGIEMHTFLEIDGIEYPDFIRLIYGFPVLPLNRFSLLVQLRRAPLQHLPYLA